LALGYQWFSGKDDIVVARPSVKEINATIMQPPNQPASSHGIDTLHRFLANKPDNGTSVIALYAKASILFERVSALVSHYHPGKLSLPGETLPLIFASQL
jgi:hypothetical protein